MKRRTKVYERDKGICHLCGYWVPPPSLDLRHPKRRATVDHLVPTVHGGTDSYENLRLAHANCNHARGDLALRSPKLTNQLAKAVESNRVFAMNVKNELDKKQTNFDIRRRGGVQALKRISDWALELSCEPDEENAVRAYYHCYETCKEIIDEFESKKGAEEGSGPFAWIKSASDLLSILRNNVTLSDETTRLIDTLLEARKEIV